MFHNNLVSLRKMKNLTQDAIAEKVGVSRQAVAKWEADDQLVVLGDEGQGLAILKSDRFLAFADAIRNGTFEQR